MRASYTVVALLIAAAVPAMAQNFPIMKAGQWETSTTTSKSANGPLAKITMCTDEAIQRQMMDMSKGMQREMCSKSDNRRDGDKFIGDSVCQMGESKMTSHSVMTIQGDIAYKAAISTTYDPPFMGMKDSSATVEGKYVGPCRDGLQPGDVVMPDGRKMNMKSMQGQAPAMPPAKSK